MSTSFGGKQTGWERLMTQGRDRITELRGLGLEQAEDHLSVRSGVNVDKLDRK